jgi:hypothetical protein
LGDGFDLTLENEKALVVEIDTTITKEGGDGSKVGFAAVDVVLARVVSERLSRDDESRVGNDFGGKTGL